MGKLPFRSQKTKRTKHFFARSERKPTVFNAKNIKIAREKAKRKGLVVRNFFGFTRRGKRRYFATKRGKP